MADIGCTMMAEQAGPRDLVDHVVGSSRSAAHTSSRSSTGPRRPCCPLCVSCEAGVQGGQGPTVGRGRVPVRGDRAAPRAPHRKAARAQCRGASVQTLGTFSLSQLALPGMPSAALPE